MGVGNQISFVGMGGGKDGLKTDLVAQILTNIRRINIGDDFKGTMMMADGGTNDLLGILPVIQEGSCNKIISIFNFNKHPPYCDITTPYSTIFDKAPCLDENDPKLEKYFEEWLKMISPFFACYFGFFENDDCIEFPLHGWEPLIYTLKDLETIDNPFWGIKAGRKIEITMIYYHMPKNFSSKLPQELNTMTRTGRLDTGDEDLDCVPELPWSNTGYNENQINMMNALGNWMVLRAWEGLKGHSGEEVFKGFSKILSLEELKEIEKDEKEVTTLAKQSPNEVIGSIASKTDIERSGSC
ncbi:hypothetical protein CTEN210_06799 [Chaetoceros tenuissimus]|uniref:Uncharacterized protein n=1 Tax=Chaetoceros tenuissimus TaxID=426638 RepID=A0AAD3CR34_9STRA|nr:hypothetical protein CTEN210_06799 [Chaetoceros tenuissimus]